MAGPRGDQERRRAEALGALIRRARRERGLTLGQLASEVPMSASNLSRLELGAQGPPPDETILRLADILEADRGQFLRAAGRLTAGESFEEIVLSRLDAISSELKEIKSALEDQRRYDA